MKSTNPNEPARNNQQAQARLLAHAESYVKQQLAGDSSGHDWWHIVRVRNMAKRLALQEQADPFVCELAALLHDVADAKLNPSKEVGLAKVRSWLESETWSEPLSAADREHVLDIVANVSYAGGHGGVMRTKEGRVVQDADRLDALGAIGIARTFAYAGAKGRTLHDPGVPPRIGMSEEQYRNEPGTAYNHFHEKLLKLKSLMQTQAGRRIAEGRHRVLEQYIRQFEAEWDGLDAEALHGDPSD